MGVDFIVPDTMRIMLLSRSFTFLMLELLSHTRTQYLAEEQTRPSADERKVLAEDPHMVPHNLWRILFRVASLGAVLKIWFLMDRVLSRVIPKYFGV